MRLLWLNLDRFCTMAALLESVLQAAASFLFSVIPKHVCVQWTGHVVAYQWLYMLSHMGQFHKRKCHHSIALISQVASTFILLIRMAIYSIHCMHTHAWGTHWRAMKLLLAKLTPGGLPPYRIGPSWETEVLFRPAVLKVLLLYSIGKSFFCTIKWYQAIYNSSRECN